MTSFIRIFYSTNATFDYLNTRFSEKLNIRCVTILMIVGAVSGLESAISGLYYFEFYLIGENILFYAFLVVLLGISLSLLMGYVVAILLYGIGKWLKGQSEFIDIRVVVAYAMIPYFSKIPIRLYVMHIERQGYLSVTDYWIINAIYMLMWLFSLKILVQGLVRYNRYGLLNALINISPLLLVGLICRFSLVDLLKWLF